MLTDQEIRKLRKTLDRIALTLEGIFAACALPKVHGDPKFTSQEVNAVILGLRRMVHRCVVQLGALDDHPTPPGAKSETPGS
jgi:hypothetical protein